MVKLWRSYDSKDYKAEHYRQLAQVFTVATQILPDQECDWAINAGVLWNQLGQPGEALPMGLQAVSKLESTHSGSNQLATAYNNLGFTYGELGDHKKALEFQLKALEIRKAVLPENHPNLALSYNNVGSTYFDTGNLEEALRCTQQAVAITEISLPEGHPDRALYQQNLAYLKQLMDMHHLKRPRCTATGGQCAPMPDYLFPLDGTDGFLICSQKFNYLGSKY